MVEKLGRNDPCLCGSGKRFQAVLYALWPVSMGLRGGEWWRRRNLST
ncbi:MAG: SEC-C domain-containing protein [Sphingobium sp.]|nr:SEC-C domain-containing protein [Sphingobium sp.]